MTYFREILLEIAALAGFFYFIADLFKFWKPLQDWVVVGNHWIAPAFVIVSYITIRYYHKHLLEPEIKRHLERVGKVKEKVKHRIKKPRKLAKRPRKSR